LPESREPTTRHRGRSRAVTGRRPALLLIGVVPLALAACGSAAASGSSTSTTTASGKASETAYTSCLKQHGVTLPNFRPGSGGAPEGGETRPSFTPGSGSFPSGTGAPGRGGGFANNPKFAAAAKACQKLRPKGGFGGFGGGRGGAGGFNSTAFAAYRNCLKLHGVTLPTPGSSTTGAGSTPSTTFNPSDPTMKAAMAACAALRPSPSSSTTTTTAG
jgi:hypothetical protein